ncbi:ARM repeat-containing protein [Atractiella rhizophila]|nr:ARM repeat-containing protein [Atractiella rhizophila]
MNVCKEKPDQLPSLEAIGMVDSDGSMPPPSRGSSFSMGGPPPLPRQPSGTIPQLPGGRYWRQGSTSSQSAMGMFQHAGDGKGDRFGSLGRTPSLSGMHGLPPHQMGRSSTLTRTASSGQMGPGGIPASPTPNASRRSNRGQGRKQAAPVAPPPGEYVAPLAHSADAWVPAIASKGQGRDAVEDPQSIEMVQRKVKSLLNKLTVERFDSISDQIIEWANKSEKETDGRILRQVIALVFEKATDEAAWSEMYARLCRKMIERISPNVVDEGIPEPNNRGGGLFRKYLLNRCQEDYERGWAQKEHTAAAAATKADEDKAKQAANEENKEAEVMSDEYYAAQKAKRQGLGLVRFIGELFKLQMLTERIMHECIKKLLSNIENPEEEDIESLCRFMTTVGKLIDTPKARDHMNIYFTRMKTLKENMKLSSRIRFMVQDVIDERDNGWKKRVEAAGPKSIAQIHQDAAKEKEEAAARKSLPRGGSRRGQNRDSSYGGVPQVGQDGWTSVGTVVPQRAMAGDLSGMGKVRETTLPISFGPTGVFTKGAKTGRGGKTGGDAPSRSVSITGGNRFDLLAAAAEPSATTVRRPSANESSASAPAIRQKLQLAPRTLPTTDPTKSEHGEESVVTTSERTPQVNQSIDNSVAEFFSVKDIQEGVANFTSLELQFRKFLVQAMADKALTSRQSDVDLYCKLLDELLKGGAVTGSTVKEGMKLLMPTLVDVAVDVPSAWKYTSQIFIAAGFSQEDVKELSELLESEGEHCFQSTNAVPTICILDEDVDEAKTSLMDAFSKAKTQ